MKDEKQPAVMWESELDQGGGCPGRLGQNLPGTPWCACLSLRPARSLVRLKPREVLWPRGPQGAPQPGYTCTHPCVPRFNCEASISRDGVAGQGAGRAREGRGALLTHTHSTEGCLSTSGPAPGARPPRGRGDASLHSIRICSSSVTSAMDSFRSSTNFCISSKPRAQKCSTCFFSEPESGATRVMP